MRATEENFVSLIKKRKEAGLVYVADKYGYIIQAVVRKYLLRLPEEEQECINDVLLAVWEGIGHYNPEKSDFKNWLAGIARYKAIDAKRRYVREYVLEPLESQKRLADKRAQDAFIKMELEEEIDELLSELSEEDGILFRKLFYEEESVQAVARRMQIKPDTVYKRVSRARKQLRKKYL